MKRIQLEPWTTYEKLCLASAVQRTGDQNWTAVSRAAKNIFEDSTKTLPLEKRPPEWFSMKQCAAQYEYLLQNVTGPRKKKRTEKGSEVSDTPSEMIMNILRQEHIEELKAMLAEEQAIYLKLKKEKEDVEAGLLDDKLEDMMAEIEAKEREKDIKIKLKFKLGEKHLDDHLTNKSMELDTPSAQPEIEVKPSSATSPLLTSLLQSPSPLTRPPVSTSASPTISLLLNSSPSIPSNDSPTLSKLLESPTSITPIIQTSDPPKPPPPPPPPPPPVQTPSTTVVIQPKPTPVVNPPVEISEEQKPEKEPKPVVKVKEETTPVKAITPEPIEEYTHGVIESEVVIEDTIEEKRKNVSRRLELELEDVETDEDVMETVEQIIEKVEEAVIETIGETGDGELCDVGINQTLESETIDDHLDTLELDHEAVELIVMGPTQGPVIAVCHETPSETPDTSSKAKEPKEVETESLNEVKEAVLNEEESIKVEKDAVEVVEEVKQEVLEPKVTEEVLETKLEELEKEIIEDQEIQSEIVMEELAEDVKTDPEIPAHSIEVESDAKDSESPIKEDSSYRVEEQEEKNLEKNKVEIPEVIVEKPEESVVEPVEELKGETKRTDSTETSINPEIETESTTSQNNVLTVIEESKSSVSEESMMPAPKPKLSQPTSQPVSPAPSETPKAPKTTLEIEHKKEPETEKKRTIRKRSSIFSQQDSKPNSPAPNTDEDRDYKAWKKSILLVYNRLAAHKYASVFLKPITEAEAAGYHSIIKRPMDLTTIKRNIETGTIRTTVEFQRDMLLMVQNAIMYNKTNTLVYKMANDMLVDMIAQMEVMVQAIGDGVPLGRDTYERLPTRGRASKAVIEDTQKRKRYSVADEPRGYKRKKLDTSTSSTTSM